MTREEVRLAESITWKRSYQKPADTSTYFTRYRAFRHPIKRNRWMLWRENQPDDAIQCFEHELVTRLTEEGVTLIAVTEYRPAEEIVEKSDVIVYRRMGNGRRYYARRASGNTWHRWELMAMHGEVDERAMASIIEPGSIGVLRAIEEASDD